MDRVTRPSHASRPAEARPRQSVCFSQRRTITAPKGGPARCAGRSGSTPPSLDKAPRGGGQRPPLRPAEVVVRPRAVAGTVPRAQPARGGEGALPRDVARHRAALPADRVRHRRRRLGRRPRALPGRQEHRAGAPQGGVPPRLGGGLQQVLRRRAVPGDGGALLGPVEPRALLVRPERHRRDRERGGHHSPHDRLRRRGLRSEDRRRSGEPARRRLPARRRAAAPAANRPHPGLPVRRAGRRHRLRHHPVRDPLIGSAMDHPTTSTLLTWMTFTPVAGAVLILLVVGLRSAGALSKAAADQVSRVLALVASAAVLVMAAYLWKAFDPSRSTVQFVQHARWIDAYNIRYFVGADGISITLVILTALISFIATIASMPWWPVNAHLDEHHFTQRAVPGYMALLLLLQTGMTGVFVSLDLFLFYVFWEVMLLPMYFLIGIWGGARKEYAAIKFFLYTLAGSVLMLLAIIGLYFNGPKVPVDGQMMHTFDLVKMADWSRTTGGYASAPAVMGLNFMRVAWVALFIGFAVKIPMFPFHTWLPDAHVEAPTPISVILAGVLLKMGIYGILRVNYGVLPEATRWACTAMAVF